MRTYITTLHSTRPQPQTRAIVRYPMGRFMLLAFLGFILLFILTALIARSQTRGTVRPSQIVTPSYPSAVTVARLHYTGGGDWYWGTSSLPNLLRFMKANTVWPVDTIEKQVMIGAPELFSYPFLFATGHGVMKFSDSDRERLREYLDRGGFLFINDSYGMESSVRAELAELFPDQQPAELPFDHPLYHSYYDFPSGPPKIHEHDDKPPRGYAITSGGRVMVYFLLEGDIGDGWEDPAVHNDPEERRQESFRMGVNLLAYALRN